jgi:ribosomal protein L29
MKITVNQLRKIINEEVENLTEDKKEKSRMIGLPKPKDFSNLSTAQIRLQIAELKRQITELEAELKIRS